jgi:hypothetical protein
MAPRRRILTQLGFGCFLGPGNPQHIGERLDSLCNVLPTFARPGCNNWVAQYKPTIIAAISTGSTAGALCRSIRACQPANKVPRVSFDEFKSLDNNTGNCDGSHRSFYLFIR